jgi:hypothetical protein
LRSTTPRRVPPISGTKSARIHTFIWSDRPRARQRHLLQGIVIPPLRHEAD